MIKKEFFNLPNLLSLSRILFGFLFLLIFILIKNTKNGNLIIIYQILAFIIFVIAIITDGLDGYFARKLKLVTETGKHLDPLTDSIFFIIVFFTFFYSNLMPFYMFLIIFIREFSMHIFLRPHFKSKGKSLPANIFGKLKTLTQSILSLLVLFFLILDKLFIIFKINFFLINYKNIEIFSFYSFLIITILSVFSFITYLFELKKI